MASTTPSADTRLVYSKPQSFELGKDLIAAFAGAEVDKLM